VEVVKYLIGAVTNVHVNEALRLAFGGSSEGNRGGCKG
jgi:hypothetical protein